MCKTFSFKKLLKKEKQKNFSFYIEYSRTTGAVRDFPGDPVVETHVPNADSIPHQELDPACGN